MKVLLLVSGIVVSVLTMSFAEEVTERKEPTGFLFQTITLGERIYDYAIYLPRNYEERERWPVIMFLHGLGESGTDGLRQVGQGIGTAVLRNPERWPFVIIFPQKPGQEEWENHEEAVLAMLQKAEQDFRIDRQRRYLTGVSQGGHGTMVFGAQQAHLWAAIAPICGYGKPEALAEQLQQLPIWAFHGDADRVVPLEQSERFVAAVKAAGGSAKLTIYPDAGHNSWDPAYAEEELPRWFLSHKKATSND